MKTGMVRFCMRGSLSQFRERLRIARRDYNRSMTRFSLGLLLAATLLRQQPDSRAPAVKPSQHGSITQTVAATTITIDYNRPVARGRDLFGALVPYDRVW